MPGGLTVSLHLPPKCGLESPTRYPRYIHFPRSNSVYKAGSNAVRDRVREKDVEQGAHIFFRQADKPIEWTDPTNQSRLSPCGVRLKVGLVNAETMRRGTNLACYDYITNPGRVKLLVSRFTVGLVHDGFSALRAPHFQATR